MNHLRPDGGLPGIPSFTKRKLLELPLDSELQFEGQFDQVLKDTTSTQAIAFQASQIAAGSPPLDLSGFKIPKRPAQSKSQGPAKKRRRGRSPVQPQHQQQHQQQQQVAQPQAQEKPQQQRSGYNSSGARGRGRGRGGARSGGGTLAGVRGSLGRHYLGQMGPSNCLFRLPHRVHRELPVNQSASVDDSPSKAQAPCGPRRGSAQNVAKEGNSAVGSLHDRTRVLFLPVPGREAFRREAAHLKPEAPERRSKTS